MADVTIIPSVKVIPKITEVKSSDIFLGEDPEDRIRLVVEIRSGVFILVDNNLQSIYFNENTKCFTINELIKLINDKKYIKFEGKLIFEQ